MQRFVLLAAVAASVAIAAAAEAAPKEEQGPVREPRTGDGAAWPAKCSLRQRRQRHRRGPGSVSIRLMMRRDPRPWDSPQ